MQNDEPVCRASGFLGLLGGCNVGLRASKLAGVVAAVGSVPQALAVAIIFHGLVRTTVLVAKGQKGICSRDESAGFLPHLASYTGYSVLSLARFDATYKPLL